MSYVDAIYNKDSDEVLVVERINGRRVYNSIPVPYTFYYEDARGVHRTMWGEPCSKVTCSSNKQFQKELRMLNGRKIFESDINPINRVLESSYLGVESPKLHIGFFDIEVDFDPTRGFASPWDPFAPITAISTYLTSEDKLFTLVIKPNLPETDKHFLSWEAAEAITQTYENCILCNDEEEMLRYFIDLIDDCDVLSGWNSSGFDIPYVVNRIERLMGKEYSKKLCLWNKRPKKRTFVSKFGKDIETYDLIGRVHLDYLELYRKHNTQELHSYRLDYVGEIEVGENKIPYEGSLDSLYKQDFSKFIAYNRQDTLLLYKIDKKRRFIDLANQLAHTNTVLLQTTMGSVALIEQAIINEAHARGMQVPNRKNVRDDVDYDPDAAIEDSPVVGAYVANPKTGIHDQVGCCDINSLYPSALRALNMGPETLVGQIRSDRTENLIAERLKSGTPRSEVWHNIFATLEYDIVRSQSEEEIIVDFEDGNTMRVTGNQLYDYIYASGNPYCVSANGTIFRTNVESIIPGLLARWYRERQDMQAKVAEFKDLVKATEDEAEKAEYQTQLEFWDQRQLARKILLNSLYGALLNATCRFYDQRIGQSVTLTGRSIARHMNSKINEIITGVYQIDGEAIIYADTDSVTADTIIDTSWGKMTIEQLFHACTTKWMKGEKEYSVDDVKVLTYNPETGSEYHSDINYVYRHKVSKAKWRITDEHGNQITVTNDHSIMVERDNVFMEVKPGELLETDILITVQ